MIDAGAVLDQTRGDIPRQPWAERSFYARDPWGNPFGVVESGTEYRGGGFEPPNTVWLTSDQPPAGSVATNTKRWIARGRWRYPFPLTDAFRTARLARYRCSSIAPGRR